MAFLTGQQALVLLSEFNISAYFDQMDPEREGEALETTVFGDTARTYIASDITDGMISVQGFADGVASAVNSILEPKVNVGGNVCTVAMSRAENDDCYLAKIIEQQFIQKASVAGVTRLTGVLKPEGPLDFGWLAHEPSAETGSGNGASKDGTAATTDGARANLHVAAYAGFGWVTIEIEDSADDASWTSIATFTTYSGVTSEQISIAGTIRRYVRAKWTLPGGVTSTTFTVAVARL